MLHFKAIQPQTLELLKIIQEKDIFRNLRLVGGTALALQIGHRISDDLDLFGELEADKDEISAALNSLSDIVYLGGTKNIHIYIINKIKVDIINYAYPWLNPS